MPTYQYACTECGERLEAVQSFSDPALTECPVCDGRLRKVFSAVGVVFKGSGFYKNDSRPTPAKSDESKPKEAAAASSGGDGGSSGSSATPAAGSPAASGSTPSSSTPSRPSTPAAKSA